MKLDKNDILLFSGDSITDGNRGKCMDCNHIMGHGYQYIVASQLALENAENMPKFINKGYSGERAENLLEKWQEDVIDNKPTILSILVGANDGRHGYFAGITPDETARRYPITAENRERMYAELRERRSTVADKMKKATTEEEIAEIADSQFINK
ncbi:MAG: hypothetical protein IJE14_11455 [Clostridia bacterium]|nr:hypothetical protein [Clostridia bacterium]